MLFTGSSEHTIDDKKRLSIASKHRAVLPQSVTAWYCVPWPGKVLRLYPEPTFLELANKWDDSLIQTDEQTKLITTLFSSAEKLEMDSGGRIRLPQKHLDLVGLGSAVSVIGAKNKLEVHDQKRWLAEEQRRFDDLSKLIAGTTPSSGNS